MKLYYYYWYDADTSEAELIGKTEQFLSNDLIRSHLDVKMPNIKVFYWRYWTDDKQVKWFDFGSWSKFYLETEEPLENIWPDVQIKNNLTF